MLENQYNEKDSCHGATRLVSRSERVFLSTGIPFSCLPEAWKILTGRGHSRVGLLWDVVGTKVWEKADRKERNSPCAWGLQLTFAHTLSSLPELTE
jgi:hypothetical protein